jgi:hypothetical protein
VDIPAAVAAAQMADTVVLCLGEGSYTEAGQYRRSRMPEIQLRLAEAIMGQESRGDRSG